MVSAVFLAIAAAAVAPAAGAVSQLPAPAVYGLDGGGLLLLAPMDDESGATLQFMGPGGIEGRARQVEGGAFADAAECRNVFVVEPRGVTWSDCHGRRRGRLASAIVRRDLDFTASDGRRIAAHVFGEAGRTGRVGIVLSHGADYETGDMGTIVPLLVREGFIVLTYDQRGSGRSEGDWKSDGIAQIGDDAAQAARELRKAGMSKVGFWGFSNGSWVALRAARLFGDPAFVVIKSGDASSVEENVAYESYAAVSDRYGEAAGRAARAATGTVMTALRTDREEDWKAAREALVSVEAAPWRSLTQLPPAAAIPLPPPAKAAYRRQLVFDPRQDILALRCPVLVMVGDRDVDVDGPASAALFRRYFSKSGNVRARVVVFHGAGHQLVDWPKGAMNSASVTGTYARGFPETMTRWLGGLSR